MVLTIDNAEDDCNLEMNAVAMQPMRTDAGSGSDAGDRGYGGLRWMILAEQGKQKKLDKNEKRKRREVKTKSNRVKMLTIR